jgi:hypothetical protein
MVYKALLYQIADKRLILLGADTTNMYEPETNILGHGDSVITIIKDGWTVGKYTGNSRENNTFEIDVVVDMGTGEKETMWLHKEDLYENTEQNLYKVKRMTSSIAQP